MKIAISILSVSMILLIWMIGMLDSPNKNWQVWGIINIAFWVLLAIFS